MIDLSGRVVIVTGGNSGIGLGIARGVARAGASVAVWSRRHERNLAAVAELERLGATAIGVQCDVSDEDNVVGAMRETLDRFGRLDCLVANAGTAGKQSFTGMSLGEWHRVLQVNLDGAFLCLREAARVLVGQRQGGSLVGVSSTSAIDGAPGQQHYAASKTALLAVMRALAVELARHQVRCNSLLPGWTDTELLAEAKTHEKFVTATIGRTPVRRWGTLHDFETVGAFLADPSLISIPGTAWSSTAATRSSDSLSRIGCQALDLTGRSHRGGVMLRGRPPRAYYPARTFLRGLPRLLAATRSQMPNLTTPHPAQATRSAAVTRLSAPTGS